MNALQRQQLRSDPNREECVACGGSGLSSIGSPCHPCKGKGSKLKADVVQHSSKSVEHYTPVEIVEAARTVLGVIDLDPASCTLANEVVQAEAFYGPGGLAADGLAEPWLGRVFLNPPGGRVPEEYKGMGTSSNAALWWATLASAWQAGEVEAAIFVGFTLEILRSAQALDVPQPLDFPICVPKSRIAFDQESTCGISGKTERVGSSSPTHANVIVYLPPSREIVKKSKHTFRLSFTEAFSPIGRCRV